MKLVDNIHRITSESKLLASKQNIGLVHKYKASAFPTGFGAATACARHTICVAPAGMHALPLHTVRFAALLQHSDYW